MGLSQLKAVHKKDRPFVSVVVAARNEETNIISCIESLVIQEYPENQYEIILVNDRSQDATGDIINRFTQEYPNVQAIHISTSSDIMAPKKWALAQGIHKAKGTIILTTDADCIVSPNWIGIMIQYFNDDVGLVAGFSPLTRYTNDSIFQKLMALDGLALAGVAAGSCGMRFPLTCSGRNLAYRKSVYHEVGGFKQIGQFISGDDDLFMQLVRTKTNWKIQYAIDFDSQVPSYPPTDLKEFFNQRIRHASKGSHYQKSLTFGLIGVYVFNLLLFITPFWIRLWPIWIGAMGLKSFFEFILIARTASLFKHEKLVTLFPMAIFLHVPYVIVFGLLGQIGKFSWKAKTFNSQIDTK